MELHHKLRRDPSWHPNSCNICGQVSYILLIFNVEMLVADYFRTILIRAAGTSSSKLFDRDCELEKHVWSEIVFDTTDCISV